MTQGDTAMKVEMRDISTVKPYEKNPKLNDAAVGAGVFLCPNSALVVNCGESAKTQG